MALKKKVLVLGSTGMLGHQVFRTFEDDNNFIVSDISYRNKLNEGTIVLDVFNSKALEEVIVKLNPDFIINCIGILVKSKKADNIFLYLNAYFPHQLKNIAKSINAKLIHISSDCVFSGTKGGYIETDIRDGQGIYAESKKLGEIIDDTNLTIRTSMIGPELKVTGEGLFHWFMNATESIPGYQKSIWSGVSTMELAKAIKWAINNHIIGLYHVTNNSSISKHNLLLLLKKYTNKNIKIEAAAGVFADKSFKDTRLIMNYKIPSYDEMIAKMVDHVRINNAIYPHYKFDS